MRDIKVLLHNLEIHVSGMTRRYRVSRAMLYKHVGIITPVKETYEVSDKI